MCNVLIGITNPKSFDLSNYLGYDITKLKDSFRVMEIVLNREGIGNGLCPLLFDGATNTYSVLPLPLDPEMATIYEDIDNIRSGRSTLFFAHANNFINSFVKRNIRYYLCKLVRKIIK